MWNNLLKTSIVIMATVIFVAADSFSNDARVYAASEGKALYEAYCTSCHGIEGNGMGVNVADMSVQPRDHTDASEMSARTDDELTRAILDGGPAVNKSVLMPPWKKVLDEAQTAAIVAHLRDLSGTTNGTLVGLADIPAATPEHEHDHAGMNSMPPATTSAKTNAMAQVGPMFAEGPRPPEALRKRYKKAQQRHFEIRVEERIHSVAPGFEAKVWAFNGQVPGPLIRVREGDEVTVDFVNLSSMEHTIHWHGMHQEGTWQSDGVPNVTQLPVPAGGKFTYKFVATRPGTLWYHCHVNVPEHVGLRGMWGALIVDPIKPEKIEKRVTKEALLMFSGWNSEVADKFGVGGHPHEKYDYFSINGKSFPMTQPLRVKQGDVLRLRLFGAGMEVAFHLHGHDILVTHKDGLPLPEPFYADVLYVAQGARYDAIVEMNNPGIWIDHDHIEHHVSNNGKAPGGAVMIVEYESVEKPDWYVWKDKEFDPDFYFSESMKQGYGMFEHDGFQGAEIPLGR